MKLEQHSAATSGQEIYSRTLNGFSSDSDIVIYIYIYIIYIIYYQYICVCCVCVFSPSFWTSSSLDVPAGVTQKEGHTGFFIHLLFAACALIFLARRIQPFLSLVDLEVEFCVLTI